MIIIIKLKSKNVVHKILTRSIATRHNKLLKDFKEHIETNNITGTNKTLTLVTTTIVSFVGSLLASAVNIALPVIGQELDASAIMLSWISISLVLSQTVVPIPAGRLADIWGRKKILLYGSLLFAISSFICGVSNSIILLITFRFVQGISAASLSFRPLPCSPPCFLLTKEVKPWE